MAVLFSSRGIDPGLEKLLGAFAECNTSQATTVDARFDCCHTGIT
jgi:hypothetical protein